jgi:hypothetical protein
MKSKSNPFKFRTLAATATLGAGSSTPVIIPGGAGVTVTPDTPSTGIEQVVITVAKGTEAKLFGRLQVTHP